MKTLVIALALVTLAGSSFGQAYWEDNIGMYYNEDGTNYCCGAPPGTFVDVYLVLTHATSATVAGWEAKLTFEGAWFPVSFTPRYDHINAATRPNEYIVGLGTPQATIGGAVVLMDIRLYNTDGFIPSYGYVGPIYFHSIPELLPAYLDGADLELVKPMYPSLGSIHDWVISLNNGCVVDDENTSFGTVKSLFR